MKQVSIKVMNDIVSDKEHLLTAQVSITIINSNGKYIVNEFPSERGDYISVNMNPRLVIKYEDKSSKWVPSRQISFNRKYLYRLQIGIKNFYKHIQKGKNYIYNDKGLLENVVKDNTDIMYIGADNQWITFEPEVLMINQIKLPGVMVTINDPANLIVISIDEYEALCACLSTLDLNVMGSNLLTLHEHMSDMKGYERLEKEKERSVPKTNTVNKRSIFGGESSPIQEIVSGPINRKKPKSIYDL